MSHSGDVDQHLAFTPVAPQDLIIVLALLMT
jgi:hypothetical protein